MERIITLVVISFFQFVHCWHEMMWSPPHTKMMKYPFEGVDFSNLPEKYNLEQKDCYSWYLKCIRYRTDFHLVCGLNVQRGLKDFFSPCQIDFMNCQHLMIKGMSLKGVNYRDNLILYNGEGKNCEWYLRQASGDTENALLMYKRTIPAKITDEEFEELKKEVKRMQMLKAGEKERDEATENRKGEINYVHQTDVWH